MKVEIKKERDGSLSGVAIDGHEVAVHEGDGIHLNGGIARPTLVTLTLIASDVEVCHRPTSDARGGDPDAM